MVSTKIWIRLAFLLFCLTFFCRLGHAKINDNAKILRFGVVKLPRGFDPGRNSSAAAVRIASLLHRNILKLDAQNNVKGDLADEWRMSSDNKKFDFCLKRALFHDGSALDLDDIRFSLNRYPSQSKHYLASTLRRLSPIVSDRASNEKQLCLSITLKESSQDFLYLLASPRLAIVKKNSNSQNPLGLGCYAMAKNETNPGMIRFVRHTRDCNFDAIEIVELPDTMESYKKIETGELDLYFGITDSQKIPQETEKLRVTYLESMMVKHLIFNLARPFAASKDFRIDLSLLIQRIVESHQNMLKSVDYNPHFMPPGMMPRSYYIADQIARKLDFSAKWKNKVDQKEFILVGATNELPDIVVAELRQVLSEIGMKLIYSSDFYGTTDKILLSGSYDAAIGGYHADFEKPEAFFVMIDTMIRGTARKDEEIDAFFKRVTLSRTIAGYDERVLQYAKDLKWLEQEGIFVPLFTGKLPVLHRQNIKIPRKRYGYFFSINDVKKL